MNLMPLRTTAHHPEADVPVLFLFDPARPMQVILIFCPGREDPVVWMMARRLLFAGVLTPPGEVTGRGDVRLRCSGPHPGGWRVHLWLCDSVGDSEEFAFDRVQLMRWLAATYRAVGFSEEHCGLSEAEMDAHLAALLAGPRTGDGADS